MLEHFFTINLPYGLKKNDKGEWMAFNREYMPLGYNKQYEFNFPLDEVPIFTEYKGLSEKVLLELAGQNTTVKRNVQGDIIQIWLYKDATNPIKRDGVNKLDWKMYCDKLEKLANLKIRHAL